MSSMFDRLRRPSGHPSLLRRLIITALVVVAAVWALVPSVVFFSLPADQQAVVKNDPKAFAALLPKGAPTSHIVPGLDLQGGVQLVLHVDVDQAIADRQARPDPDGVDRDQGWQSRLRAAAVTQAVRTIGDRIDGLHVAEPSISRRGPEHIQVQLPGYTDPASAKKLLGRTARLSLQRVADETEFLREVGPLPAGVEFVEVPQQGPAGAVVVDRFLMLPADQAAAVLQLVAPKLPADLEVKLGDLDRVPRGDVVDAANPTAPLRTWILDRQASVTGEDLDDASVGMGSAEQPGPVVSLTFSAQGARNFATLTTENVGRRMAIVLEDRVNSAPIINEPITGGRAQISMGGSGALNEQLQSANDLVLVLKSGSLMAPMTVVEERSVGPGLGADALHGAGVAASVGALLVALFMIGVYRLGGALAMVGAALNVTLVLAALSLMGASLTLPGIAGLVLTVGMAVDANIIINERIAEEAKRTGSRRAAIAVGYSRAWSAIIDSNVSSFLAGIVCLELGSGPVQSFAVTLLLGIASTLFTAVFVTRLLHDLVQRLWPSLDGRPIRQARLFAENPARDLIKHGRAFVLGGAGVVSLIVAVAVIVGLPWGIDFAGGLEARVHLDTPTTTVDVRDALTAGGLERTHVQQVGDDGHEWLVRVERGDTDARVDAVKQALSTRYDTVDVLQADTVDGTVADDLKTSGVLALVATLAAILVYVAIRFDSWFAPGAVIALLHDPLGALAVFAFGRLEVDLPTIAALLTTVGYSISHTIVIYDRVRETMPPEPPGGLPIAEVRDVVRRAVNDTLHRTVFTTLTVLFTTIAIWIFGGESLHSFAACLTVGCVVGAWSSIFMAPSIYLWLRERFPRRAEAPSTGPSRQDTEQGVV